jgi:hypothetical protein
VAKRCDAVACVPLRASWRYPRRAHIDGEEIRSSPGISGRAGVSSLWNALCRAFDPWKAKGRRDALKCMIWAGTGVIWTLSGGVPKSSQLLGIGAVSGARVSAPDGANLSE